MSATLQPRSGGGQRGTYYCSVQCQEKHWKEGDTHNQSGLATMKDRRMVTNVKAQEGGKGGKAAEEEDHHRDEESSDECIICPGSNREKRCVVERTATKDDPSVRSGSGSSAKATKKPPRDKDNECAICLKDLADPEFGPVQILDCTHSFHKMCVEITVDELQKVGVQQACPICRAMLPESAEKMYADGCMIFFPIRKCVKQRAEGWWDPLSSQQQQVMDEVRRQLGVVYPGEE